MLDQELIPYRYSSLVLLVLLLVLVGTSLFKSDRDKIWLNCSSSTPKYASVESRIFELTSHIQDGGHGVRPPLAAAYTATSPVAR